MSSIHPSTISANELERLCRAARSVAHAELSRRMNKPLSEAALTARLAEGLSELNAQLTSERSRRRSGYLADPRLQLAYLVHHFPIHAAKVAILCRENLPLRAVDGPLRIVDVGAGPLSATAGALLALGGPAEAIAIDRATAMMRLGERVVKELFPDVTTTLQTAGVRDAPQTMRNHKPHLTIAANVLGELNERERNEFLLRAWDALPDDGHLLVLEPATRIHGHGLIAAREALRAARSVHIHAPCIGSPDCPLVGRPDWCHSERRVPWPRVYLDVAHKAGLAPETLKFSYLWLSRAPVPQREPGLLRLIGGPMSPSQGTLLRYACGPHGRVTLEGARRTDLESLPRGALMQTLGLKTRVESEVHAHSPDGPRHARPRARPHFPRRGRGRPS